MPSQSHASNVASTVAVMRFVRDEWARDEGERESLAVAMDAAEDYLADLEHDAEIPDQPDEMDWWALGVAETNLDGMAEKAADRDEAQRFEAGRKVLHEHVQRRREGDDE